MLQTIKTLKSSTAPGLDVFSGLYYKKFAPLLVPYLINYFYALKQGSFPSADALRAHITMLPKSADDAFEPQAFGPNSLLNESLKIFGKILGNRINQYLSLLVYRGQVGFVPGRQAGNNIRKVAHIIHLLNHRKIPGFLLSLDIYKTFDSVVGILATRVEPLGVRRSLFDLDQSPVFSPVDLGQICWLFF